MEAQEKYKWHFIGSLVVVSLIAIIGFVCLSLSYHNRLTKIAELQNQDCKRIETILQSQVVDRHYLLKEIDALSSVFGEHEERMQELMEIEFGKLQNDFNFISLWDGARDQLLAPRWSRAKLAVLDAIDRTLYRNGWTQGCRL